MSSLGVSILILAGLAIAVVVAVNLFQAMGRRKRLAASRPAGADEGAVGKRGGPGQRPARDAGAGRPIRQDRAEPRLDGATSGLGDAGEPDFSTVLAEVIEDDPAVADALATAPLPAGGPLLSPAGGPLLSPACDGIVVLLFEQPLPGERLIAATQGVRRAGGKPILVDGLPVAADDDGAVPLSAGLSFRALRVGVLLANRHGPLNAMEYPEFVASVQGIADQLGALADIPEMADALAQARELDATCAQLDAQIGLNVDVPEPLGPPELAALAGALGLVDRGGHRHARLGLNGELVFTMSLTDSPQRIGFLLDVPRTPAILDGWAAMLEGAQEVASQLSGRLVDDAGRPIPIDALDTIARQLDQRYASLDAIGLPAGSALALRVFN